MHAYYNDAVKSVNWLHLVAGHLKLACMSSPSNGRTRVHLNNYSGCSFTTTTAWPFDDHVACAVLLVFQLALGGKLLQVRYDPANPSLLLRLDVRVSNGAPWAACRNGEHW